MIRVYVSKQSAYPVSVPEIKKSLRTFFKEKGIVSDADVEVALVGERKMVQLAKKYLKEKGTLHSVLAFPSVEAKGEFVFPPDNIVHLGEIAICYPKVLEEAKKENKLINQKLLELIEHGARHLMGENNP